MGDLSRPFEAGRLLSSLAVHTLAVYHASARPPKRPAFSRCAALLAPALWLSCGNSGSNITRTHLRLQRVDSFLYSFRHLAGVSLRVCSVCSCCPHPGTTLVAGWVMSQFNEQSQSP